tara:strand:- start:93 stop:494 length:402 start_codon:yes stop_codon:yes gene_type:complete
MIKDKNANLLSIEEKNIRKVSGAILTCYTALHYLQETKHLGVFRQRTSLNLKRTMLDLIEIEKDWYDKTTTTDISEETTSKMIGNQMEYTDAFLDFDFADFTKLQEVFVAFTLDRKRLVSISDKILIKDGAKK